MGYLDQTFRYFEQMEKKDFKSVVKVGITDACSNIVLQPASINEQTHPCFNGHIHSAKILIGHLEISISWQSKKISNDQELIQSDPISCPQNQKGNN